MQDVVRILTPVVIFFAGTLYLALMRDIMEEPMEEPGETNMTAEELIRREYGECAFFNDKTFISDGKLYVYEYDKDGQLHVFYEEDVADKVITGRGKEKPSETNMTAEELIRREYGECAFFNDETFISDGKLYVYEYDKNGQLHVFYEEDVTDNVITGRGKEEQDE